MRIAVLMTCHNRCAQTLACLRSLFAQVEVKGGGGERKIDVFLVDDGSTDGTYEKVEKLGGGGEGQIHLIRGTGNLYWAKGMHLAWCKALEEERIHSPTPTSNSHFSYSGFLWLNDDVELYPDALEKLASALQLQLQTPTIIVGEVVDEKGTKIYGTMEGGVFSGNFVYVPRSAFEKVGLICGGFRHAWGDIDYALRAQRAGVPVVSCGVVGTSSWHPMRPDPRKLNLRQRWATLFDPKGWCVHDVWLYRRRNFGFLQAVCSSVHLVLHVFFLI